MTSLSFPWLAAMSIYSKQKKHLAEITLTYGKYIFTQLTKTKKQLQNQFNYVIALLADARSNLNLKGVRSILQGEDMSGGLTNIISIKHVMGIKLR